MKMKISPLKECGELCSDGADHLHRKIKNKKIKPYFIIYYLHSLRVLLLSAQADV